MKKSDLLTSVICGGFALLFLLLKYVWVGFIYFACLFLVYICVYWIVMLIFNYKEEFFDGFEEKFKLYYAKTINFSNVTAADIENNPKIYIKKFKKTLIKDKLIEIGKMLFLLSLTITLVISMSTQIF